MELRVAHPNKGDTVSSILEGLYPDVKVAYLGDDLTDEDAFRTLTNRGLTVGRRAFRKTCAQIWLKPPLDLIGFLEQWRSCVSASTAPVRILLLMQPDQEVISVWRDSAPFWEKHREIIQADVCAGHASSCRGWADWQSAHSSGYCYGVPESRP